MKFILNRGTRNQLVRGSRSQLKYASVALMLMGVAVAFGTSPSTIMYSGAYDDITEVIAIPSPQRVVSTDVHGIAREIRIERGDTVSGLLVKLGIHDESLRAFLYSDEKTDTIFRQLAPGRLVNAEVMPDGKLLSFKFPLNGDSASALQITRANDRFISNINSLSFDRRIISQSATIRHSLFGAADDAGIPDDVAIGLANIFGGEIDFHRDLRKGDSFTVVYELEELSGKPVRVNQILAAEFINDGKPYQAFWYRHDDTKGGYYTADGASLKKAFLRSPLEFSRITSGFSNARYHPVLREMRAHRGIDYGAPIGTRVRATGDGVISFAGIQGGYGKVIFIRHKGNKMTVYGHLSGFASGMRVGKRVSQSDVIGYVGATGLATGPHLHYEFRVGGMHRNPLTIALPAVTPLPTATIPVFRSMVIDYMNQMTLSKGWQLTKLD